MKKMSPIVATVLFLSSVLAPMAHAATKSGPEAYIPGSLLSYYAKNSITINPGEAAVTVTTPVRTANGAKVSADYMGTKPRAYIAGTYNLVASGSMMTNPTATSSFSYTLVFPGVKNMCYNSMGQAQGYIGFMNILVTPAESPPMTF